MMNQKRKKKIKMEKKNDKEMMKRRIKGRGEKLTIAKNEKETKKRRIKEKAGKLSQSNF